MPLTGRQSFRLQLVGGLLLVAGFTAGFVYLSSRIVGDIGWSGAARQTRELLAATGERLRPNGAGQDSTYQALEVFDSALILIREQHLEPVEAQTLMDGAVRGLFNALDPDSAFLSPEEADLYRNPLPGRVGIGLEKRYYLHVDDVLPGSPAAEAGIERGDAITAIDGRSTRDLRVPAGELLLTGRLGSRVELSIRGSAESESEDVVLLRVALPPAAVEHEAVEEGIGVVRIRRFHEETPIQLEAAVRALAAQGVGSIALDVRGSRGMTQDCAPGAESAAVFLDGVRVETVQRGSDGDEVATPVATTATEAVWRGQLAVVTDASTVCPGEVLAAALAEGGRAEIVGGRTAGRAGQPEFIEVDGGGAILLSTSHVRAIGGDDILGTGVRPTLLPDALEEMGVSIRELDDENPELELAIRVLRHQPVETPPPPASN